MTVWRMKEFKHFKINHSVNFKESIKLHHRRHIVETRESFDVAILKKKNNFYGDYMAKFMFLKKRRLLNLDPTVEFFRLVGTQ